MEKPGIKMAVSDRTPGVQSGVIQTRHLPLTIASDSAFACKPTLRASWS